MKLEINITKGKFWTLVVLAIAIVGVFVFADSHLPSNPGHSIGQIDGLDERVNGLITERIDGMEIVKIPAPPNSVDDQDYGGRESFSSNCRESKVAIGCSIMKERVWEEEDVGFCNVNNDKKGCTFLWDVDSTFDGDVTAYCYCI
ncbi:hypothetical protein HYV86_05360 [Candidatus Woesearchaeota archaeon]|nr:hypothetical protein [Candidatus Woesearchaeota archaeon]